MVMIESAATGGGSPPRRCASGTADPRIVGLLPRYPRRTLWCLLGRAILAGRIETKNLTAKREEPKAVERARVVWISHVVVCNGKEQVGLTSTGGFRSW